MSGLMTPTLDELADAYTMREPCPDCGTTDGFIRERNGQACVFCITCSRWIYNAPKLERGVAQRSVRSRPEIKPSQKRRILERDGTLCVLCGAHPPALLHIGHLLSVDDGRRLDVPDEELYSDVNLAVMCEECNLGFGKSTVALKLVARILHVRYLRENPPPDDQA